MPEAAHEAVAADAALFWRVLRELHARLDGYMPKLTKLGGNEIDLHLLYTQVRGRGLIVTVGCMLQGRLSSWEDVRRSAQVCFVAAAHVCASPICSDPASSS